MYFLYNCLEFYIYISLIGLYWGCVRKMRIYNAKEMSPIKKADFHLKESTFLVILNQLTHPLAEKGVNLRKKDP